MDYVDFSKALLLFPGIVRIELMDDDLLSMIHGIEHSDQNVGFMPNYPLGLKEISEYSLRLILFCSSEFPMFTEPFMDIIDSRGKRVGHDVLDEDLHEYDDPQNIWLTRNIFFNPGECCDYNLTCVIRSLALDLPNMPDDVRPRVYYPCRATAETLNQRFGVKGKIVSTVLIGVDNVLFRGFLADQHDMPNR